jgi:hypothetical protein
MNHGFVIAFATAVLKHVLQNGLIDHDIPAILGSDIAVSGLPPDRVLAGGDEQAQLNLFLWQITPNTSLRQSPAQAAARARGAHSQHPLPVDLHYVLSAYGARDFQLEVLLGAAMHILHQSANLQHADLRALADSLAATASDETLGGVLGALHRAGVVEQIEQLQIVPQFLVMEEMARVWAATQSHYRPSAAYRVSLFTSAER